MTPEEKKKAKRSKIASEASKRTWARPEYREKHKNHPWRTKTRIFESPFNRNP